jgi:hypothetical protein
VGWEGHLLVTYKRKKGAAEGEERAENEWVLV